MGVLCLRHFSDTTDVHPLHREPGAIRARVGDHHYRSHFSIYDQNPGPCVELRGLADAAFVRAVSGLVAAIVPAADRIDAADYACLRRYAPSTRRRRILCLSLRMGTRSQRDLFHFRDRVLPLDLRVRALPRFVGEVGIRSGVAMRVQVWPVQLGFATSFQRERIASNSRLPSGADTASTFAAMRSGFVVPTIAV